MDKKAIQPYLGEVKPWRIRELIQQRDDYIIQLEVGNELWEEILQERKRQDKKWGDQRNLSDMRWLGIVTEEIGETAEEVLSDSPEKMRKEVIEVCASALVWLECIDRGDPIRDRFANAATLRVIANDLERGHVVPGVATLPRVNFLRRLARHLEES